MRCYRKPPDLINVLNMPVETEERIALMHDNEKETGWGSSKEGSVR